METIERSSGLTIASIFLDWQGKKIEVWLQGNGERIRAMYVGVEAESLMIALNKANLSVKSLHRRVMEKLIADGKITGTISGAPD